MSSGAATLHQSPLPKYLSSSRQLGLASSVQVLCSMSTWIRDKRHTSCLIKEYFVHPYASKFVHHPGSPNE